MKYIKKHIYRSSGGFGTVELISTVIAASLVMLAAAGIMKLAYSSENTLFKSSDELFDVYVLKTRLDEISSGGELVVTELESGADGWTLYGFDMDENELVLMSYSASDCAILFGEYVIIENVTESSAEFCDVTRLLTVSITLDGTEYERSVVCRMTDLFE
ncbi:MAG: hypothetical protein LUI61_05635 [Firmicutes bacterium]|nr:hypothetical protein [Bacillota bacterium]